MSSQEPLRRSTRARLGKPMFDVDLNIPARESQEDQEGTSNCIVPQGRQAGQQEHASLPAPIAPIDVEASDDDISISSPRAFLEAKNNARRNRGHRTVVDVESDERARLNKRMRNQMLLSCEAFIYVEGNHSSMMNTHCATMLPSPPPPPKEPTFSCPVCMGPLVEEMSTKCGHIFCKGCIKGAIAAQGKCPTCRRKTAVKDIIRIYLPSTRSS